MSKKPCVPSPKPAPACSNAVKAKRRVHRQVTGNHRNAPSYEVFSKDNSGKGVATYQVSWNAEESPHGHLLEYGHVQRYAVFIGKDGRVAYQQEKARAAPANRRPPVRAPGRRQIPGSRRRDGIRAIPLHDEGRSMVTRNDLLNGPLRRPENTGRKPRLPRRRPRGKPRDPITYQQIGGQVIAHSTASCRTKTRHLPGECLGRHRAEAAAIFPASQSASFRPQHFCKPESAPTTSRPQPLRNYPGLLDLVQPLTAANQTADRRLRAAFLTRHQAGFLFGEPAMSYFFP